MAPLFALPDELVIASLMQNFPGREAQIRSLATLAHVNQVPPKNFSRRKQTDILLSQPRAAPCHNIVVHGPRATGKSAVIQSLLQRLSEDTLGDGSPPKELRFAILNSVECVSGRHLFERTINGVADALGWDKAAKRCETVSQLTAELSKMLKEAPRPDGSRFVLVFDAIDRQREAPPTLVPALARLSEIVRLSSLTSQLVLCPHVLGLNLTMPRYQA